MMKCNLAYTIAGTHQGDFMEISATNGEIKARGTQISKLKTVKWQSGGKALMSLVFKAGRFIIESVITILNSIYLSSALQKQLRLQAELYK